MQQLGQQLDGWPLGASAGTPVAAQPAFGQGEVAVAPAVCVCVLLACVVQCVLQQGLNACLGRCVSCRVLSGLSYCRTVVLSELSDDCRVSVGLCEAIIREVCEAGDKSRRN